MLIKYGKHAYLNAHLESVGVFDLDYDNAWATRAKNRLNIILIISCLKPKKKLDTDSKLKTTSRPSIMLPTTKGTRHLTAVHSV